MWWTTLRSPQKYSLPALLLLPLAFAACEDDSISPDEPGYDCSAQSENGRRECLGLVALFEGTNGPGWEDSSGWLADQSPCSWFGATCEGGSVTELDLSHNNLTGSIPPELEYVAGLETLRMWSNQLSGSIPPEFGTLPDLKVALLDGNQFTGPIPSELGNLSSLEHLWLAGNQLTGSIPAELGNLSSLQGLFLYSNQLTGPIPDRVDVRILPRFPFPPNLESESSRCPSGRQRRVHHRSL